MVYYCEKCHCKTSRRIQRIDFKDMTIHVWNNCHVCNHNTEERVYDLKGNKASKLPYYLKQV